MNRIGGSSGNAAVNWEVTPGTGDLSDIVSPSAGVLNFVDGELFKTFTITIDDDDLREVNETLNLTISGTNLDFETAARRCSRFVTTISTPLRPICS